jgi:hypothetical protein
MPNSHGREESLMPSLDRITTVRACSGVEGRV